MHQNPPCFSVQSTVADPIKVGTDLNGSSSVNESEIHDEIFQKGQFDFQVAKLLANFTVTPLFDRVKLLCLIRLSSIVPFLYN